MRVYMRDVHTHTHTHTRARARARACARIFKKGASKL